MPQDDLYEDGYRFPFFQAWVPRAIMLTGIAAQNVQLGSPTTLIVAETASLSQEYHPITISMGSIGLNLLVQNVANGARHGCGEMAGLRRCHRGTCVNILKELKEWAAATSYPFPIKWIHGTVAMGKSTIVETMCRYLSAEGLLMAAFLFPRTGDCRNNLTQAFVPTLAYELSISIPGTRPYIERAIEKDPLIFSQAFEVQAQALITSPLLDLYRSNRLPALYPRVIVVDGLDECGGRKQDEILETLIFICRHIPFPLAILVASRPEPYILYRFNHHDLYNLSERLVLDGSSEDANQGIRKYYEDNLNDIRINHPSRQSLPTVWPPAGHVDWLVGRTSGQFGFAAVVIGFVKLIRHNPAVQLDLIVRQTSSLQKKEAFSPLDQLYATILRNIEPKFRSGTIRILGVLVLMGELTTLTLTPRSIEKLLHLGEGVAQHLLFDVQSLIQVEPESSRLTIAHNSFREFLFDESRANNLHVDPSVVYEDLLKNAISLLMDGVDEDLQGPIDNILTFSEKADPTPGLQVSFERGIENIDKIYYSSSATRRLVHCPLFYEAAKSSKLKDANILSERILGSYTRLLSESIHQYIADDPSIACLILASRFRGEDDEDEYLYQLILDTFSRFPAMHTLGIEHGMCLRDVVLPPRRGEHRFNRLPHSDPILRAMDLSRTTIACLVSDMADRDQYYSKTARYLLGYMFVDSPHHVPAVGVLLTALPTLRKLCFGTVLPRVIPETLAASPPDLELFQYITANELSDDYWEFEAIVNAINNYVERTAEALKLSSSSPSSVMGAEHQCLQRSQGHDLQVANATRDRSHAEQHQHRRMLDPYHDPSSSKGQICLGNVGVTKWASGTNTSPPFLMPGSWSDWMHPDG